MPDPLALSIWHALTTDHSHLALRSPHAARYPAAVAPFAALHPATPADDALAELASLVDPGETVFIPGDRPPETPHFAQRGFVSCLQMALPEDLTLNPSGTAAQIVPLTCADSAEMLALIAIAFPGYFRAETCRMGEYFGIRDPNTDALIAMGGERLCLTDPSTHRNWREISGVCTHPAHTGRGHGTSLMAHLVARHRTRNARSWLHVVADNTRAIALYQHLGFETLRQVHLHRLVRLA